MSLLYINRRRDNNGKWVYLDYKNNRSTLEKSLTVF